MESPLFLSPGRSVCADNQDTLGANAPAIEPDTSRKRAVGAMDSAVVLISGGINSTVAAARTARDRRLNLLYMDCSHPAARPEREAVQTVARRLEAERVLILEMPHVAQIQASSPSAHRGAAPDGIELAGGGLPAGLMPTLLCAGVQWAARIGAKSVVTGVSQLCDEADREVGPGQGSLDHQREFHHVFGMMLETIRPAKSAIQLEVPLIDLPREDVIRLGLRFGAPLEATWSCHLGGDMPCGQCVGCRSRSRAFLAAGEQDPARPVAV